MRHLYRARQVPGTVKTSVGERGLVVDISGFSSRVLDLITKIVGVIEHLVRFGIRIRRKPSSADEMRQSAPSAAYTVDDLLAASKMGAKPSLSVDANDTVARMVLYLLDTEPLRVETQLRSAASLLSRIRDWNREKAQRGRADPESLRSKAPPSLADLGARELTSDLLNDHELIQLLGVFHRIDGIAGQPSGHLFTQIQDLRAKLQDNAYAASRTSPHGFVTLPEGSPLPSDDASPDAALTDEQQSTVASTSNRTIDHALARLFMRLGPPPEGSDLDYVPTVSGDGGAAQ